MKILVIPSWYPPKGGRFFRNQAIELATLGHHVEVLYLEERGFTDKINSKIEYTKSQYIDEFHFIYKRIPFLNELNNNLYINKYKKLIEKHIQYSKPDIIKVDSCCWAGVAVSEVVKKNNLPFIITEQKSVFFNKELPYKESLKTRISNAFNHSKIVIANSNEMKKSLSRISQSVIKVIPNMVNTEVFIINTEINKNKTFTFITVGNLIPVKGYDILIKAFTELEKNVSIKIQLHIIGKGSEKKTLLGIIDKFGLKDKVKLLGYKTIPQLVNEYNKAHVYISSSIKETFGMTIIEAMSCGLPVVSTKSGGPNDIINTNNGFLAEPNNIKNLVLNMTKMLTEYDNFTSLKIREQIIEKYSLSKVSKEIENVLVKALKS